MKTQELDDLKRHAHILGFVYEEITPKEEDTEDESSDDIV